MASASVLNELNSQLKTKAPNDSSEAEKITVVESNAGQGKDEANGESKKTKKKGGIFKRLKNAVMQPLQRKNRLDRQENGKLKTKSTSDLADVDDADASHHDSKAKHGISGFFGRQMKLRSSWKGKDKNARKNEVASEPVSPDQAQHRLASPVRALNAKEREELATINKSLADDSFFQISLTSDTPNTTVMNDTSISLGDFDALDNDTSGLSRQNVVQDRIRLAPKGRRKPTRFSPKTDTDTKTDTNQEEQIMEKPKTLAVGEASAVPEVKSEENTSKVLAAKVKEVSSPESKKPVVSEKPKKPPPIAEKSKKPALTAEKESPKLDLNDVVIIKTPTEEKVQTESAKLFAPTSETLGSWENIASPRIQKNALDSKVASKNGNGENVKAEEKFEKNVDVNSKAKQSKEDVIKQEKVIVQDDADGKKSNEANKDEDMKDKGQEILDLIEGKIEKPNESDRKIKTEEKSFANGSDSKLKSSLSSSNKDINKDPFDVLVARTSKQSEDRSLKSNENKREVKFSAEKNNSEDPSQKNWSFDLRELDDMRSNDLQPLQFQRSKSMSEVKKSSQPPLSKSISIDSSMTLDQDKEGQKEETETKSEQNKLPDWIAIAKAKHQRNVPEDEETLEDTMDEIHDIASKIAQNEAEQPNPVVKDKPTTPVSKIPKPAFKSQSLKLASPSQQTNLKPKGTVCSKVASPTSTCLVCGKPAYQFERCDVDGQVIHKNCAKCSMCSRTMNVGTIRVINDKVFCGIHAKTAAS